jgi:hypothetical protein
VVAIDRRAMGSLHFATTRPVAILSSPRTHRARATAGGNAGR